MIEHIYQYLAHLNIKKSKAIESNFPFEDKVNWLFLEKEEKQYSFIYNIKSPKTSLYNSPFEIEVKFLMYDELKNIIELERDYKVYRGEEEIGTIKLLDVIIDPDSLDL
ncbi:hypothetical protein [Aquimarina algiphila]|uniref:hypothetical protein n=1 Tax=Aquimarina algiphila TaxID=2047982 RepID=UPI00232EEFF3|nr:hypothetical protein [Aquimarina algiphila]